VDGLKEELAKLQGQMDIAQSCLEVAQQQARRYSEQLEASQKSLRCLLLLRPQPSALFF
jgi:hypothetical protein